MNTIDNRPRLAFGMQITTRAEELILAETKNLVKATATEVVGKGKNTRNVQKPVLDNIKGLVNHKKTDDLILDAFVDGEGKYHALVKFANGTDLKKRMSCDFAGDKFGFSLSFINKQKLKFTRSKLKEKYLKAKEEVAKMFAFEKFASSKRVQARFEDDSAKFIPKLDGKYALEDLKELILGAPERFSFSIAKENSDSKYKLFVATKDYPMSEEFPLNYPKTVAVKPESGGTMYKENVYDIKADLLKFERKVLGANNRAFLKEAHSVEVLKKHLKTAFKKSKGVEFTPQAQFYILTSTELKPEQLKNLLALAKRESSKDFQLNIEKVSNGYHAVINPKVGGAPSSFASGPKLANVVDYKSKSFMEQFMEKYEKSYAERISLEVARNQREENYKALTDSDIYQNKFDEATKRSIEPLSTAYDFDNLKNIVENTPKIKLKLSEHDMFDEMVLQVAHEDYPAAGYMTISTGSGSLIVKNLLNRINAEKINHFAQTTLKEAHEKELEVQVVKEDLANFFAQARANKNK